MKTLATINHVALYARVSTKDGRQDTENQLIALRDYCAKQGWEIAGEYIDHETGGTSKRPQFQQMFADARLRKFDLVLFWSLDRLSREGVKATLDHLEKLTGYGVAWRSHTEEYLDSCGIFKDAVLAILAVIAKQERVRRSERASAAIARLRRAGKTDHLGRPRNLIISTTYKGIDQWGKRRNVRDDDGVRKHLKANERDKWITRPCPAIVTENMWNRANAALHKNQRFAMAHAKNYYLLRGVIKCGLCGLTYIGTATTRPSGKKEFYYRCNGKQGARGLYGENGQRCPSPSLPGAHLEAQVWSDIEGFLSKPGVVIQELEEQIIADGGGGHRLADDIRELEAALARKGEARRRALDAYTESWISKEEFSAKLLRIEAEAADIERSLKKCRDVAASAESRTLALGAARSVLEELQTETRGELTFEQRRRAVEALVYNITVTHVEGQKNRLSVYAMCEPNGERQNKYWAQSASLAPDYTGTRADNNCNEYHSGVLG